MNGPRLQDLAASGPPPAATAQAPSGLEALLALEAAARAAATPLELVHALAEDARGLLRADQIFVFRVRGRRFRALAVSGQSSVERSSPLIQDVEQALARLDPPLAGPRPRTVALDTLWPEAGRRQAEYPFHFFCVVPLALRDGTVFGAALLARQEPWTDRDLPLAQRVGGSFAHAWAALAGKRALRRGRLARFATPAIATALLAAGFIPVPLTALAPVEVAARDPMVIAAPLDGVVKSVEVSPNARVAPGDVLVRFVDTALRGRYEVAEQSVAVAEARERRLAQAAFRDPEARRELAVATSELDLARAERDAARDALERSVVRAERAGIAVYESRRDIEGRPHATGEKLMLLADPEAIEYRIELPVKDAVVARDGAPVRVYTDADPLTPLDAAVTHVGFQPVPVPGGGLAFILRASPQGGEAHPRIGFRGTARVEGQTVSLAYFLLRRPLTALRQQVGL